MFDAIDDAKSQKDNKRRLKPDANVPRARRGKETK